MYLLLRIRLILHFHVSFLGGCCFSNRIPPGHGGGRNLQARQGGGSKGIVGTPGRLRPTVKCSSPLRPSNDEILQLFFFGG